MSSIPTASFVGLYTDNKIEAQELITCLAVLQNLISLGTLCDGSQTELLLLRAKLPYSAWMEDDRNQDLNK